MAVDYYKSIGIFQLMNIGKYLQRRNIFVQIGPTVNHLLTYLNQIITINLQNSQTKNV